jgi:hypothetical protein
MDYVYSFDEFLNEARLTYKRKYTDTHPEQTVYDRGPVREKVLSFVNEKGKVTHNEMMNFIKGVNEETGGTTSRKWVNKNTSYFKIRERNGEKIYSLSEKGKRVHNSIMSQKTL